MNAPLIRSVVEGISKKIDDLKDDVRALLAGMVTEEERALQQHNQKED